MSHHMTTTYGTASRAAYEDVRALLPLPRAKAWEVVDLREHDRESRALRAEGLRSGLRSVEALDPTPHTVLALALRCPAPSQHSVLSATHEAVHSVQMQVECSTSKIECMHLRFECTK
jgi:hypothetical protein